MVAIYDTAITLAFFNLLLLCTRNSVQSWYHTISHSVILFCIAYRCFILLVLLPQLEDNILKDKDSDLPTCSSPRAIHTMLTKHTVEFNQHLLIKVHKGKSDVGFPDSL